MEIYIVKINLNLKYHIIIYSFVTGNMVMIFINRVAQRSREIMQLIASVCTSVSTLTPEPFDLRPWYSVCRSTLTFGQVGSMSRSQVKGQGQMPKIAFGHHCYIALRLRLGSRSNVWRTAVDIRGSALPSAAKSNNHHYQSKVIDCVSVISQHLQIIVRMRSIGF